MTSDQHSIHRIHAISREMGVDLDRAPGATYACAVTRYPTRKTPAHVWVLCVVAIVAFIVIGATA